MVSRNILIEIATPSSILVVLEILSVKVFLVKRLIVVNFIFDFTDLIDKLWISGIEGPVQFVEIMFCLAEWTWGSAWIRAEFVIV
jgi:hypothetical protein